MGFIGSVAAAPANIDYLNYGQEIFDRPRGGAWSILVDDRGSIGSEGLSLYNIGPSPGVAEITGSRPFATLRRYNHLITPKKWGPAGIALRRDEVEGDKTGAISKRLKDYLDVNADFYAGPIITALLGNPLGIDQVALLSNSHPHGNGGAGFDNLAAAFTGAIAEASIERMRSLTNEYGEPMGLTPTHIVCGPALEKEVLDYFGADRIVPIGPAGSEAAASVNAVGMLPNWVLHRGRVDVIVDSRIVGTGFSASWFLMDLSKGVKPLALGEVIRPQAFVADQPNSPMMIDRSEYAYYSESFAAIGGAVPHIIDGYIG